MKSYGTELFDLQTRYGTTDPVEIARNMNLNISISELPDSVLAIFTTIDRTPHLVLSGRLNENEKNFFESSAIAASELQQNHMLFTKDHNNEIVHELAKKIFLSTFIKKSEGMINLNLIEYGIDSEFINNFTVKKEMR